jgi:hypothetical protein
MTQAGVLNSPIHKIESIQINDKGDVQINSLTNPDFPSYVNSGYETIVRTATVG